jgi:hypothetical protein
MNTDALFLFLILLLGLVLCSFLGGNCGQEGFDITYTTDASGGTVTVDGSNNIAQTVSNMYQSTFDNYNHYSGSSSSSQLQSGAVYTDGSGNNVTVVLNANGTINLQLNQVNNNTPVILAPQSGSTNVYVGTGFYSNMTATIIQTSSGQMGIKVTMGNGRTIIFTPVNSTPITSTQYYGSTGTPVQSSSYSTAYGGSATTYNGAYGGSAGTATGPQGNSAYYAQGPQGNTVAGTTSSGSSSNYYNSLPPGIPQSQIPQGQEDLYILKSQVVPPVCPVCPSISSSSNDPDKEAKCPPCAPCARCPEPSFECKKVPNYSAIDNQYLPQPVLSDFSTFGM